MTRAIAIFIYLLTLSLFGYSDEKSAGPSYDYDVARSHEIKPHRRTIPTIGVQPGFNQLRLRLTVSSTGDVLNVEAGGDREALKFWPQLQDEVKGWKFTPFTVNGKAIEAEVEEYLDLVPPERLPANHVASPPLQADSQIEITLRRSGCLGDCPSYMVTISTTGIIFDGQANVVAAGKHVDQVDAVKVRDLARKFIAADFYSMDNDYSASVTDAAGYALAITIDGHRKEVGDYVGRWTGMPGIIVELEDEVDAFAKTGRWVSADPGLVGVLKSEKFNFQTFAAQVILKEAAARGKAGSVEDLLEAGVPLKTLPAPMVKDAFNPFKDVGWLYAAQGNPDVLRILIGAGASKSDQSDKDLGLVEAARSGNIGAVRALIAYGANPNADLSRLVFTEHGSGMTMQGPGNETLWKSV